MNTYQVTWRGVIVIFHATEDTKRERALDAIARLAYAQFGGWEGSVYDDTL